MMARWTRRKRGVHATPALSARRPRHPHRQWRQGPRSLRPITSTIQLMWAARIAIRSIFHAAHLQYDPRRSQLSWPRARGPDHRAALRRPATPPAAALERRDACRRGAPHSYVAMVLCCYYQHWSVSHLRGRNPDPDPDGAAQLPLRTGAATATARS